MFGLVVYLLFSFFGLCVCEVFWRFLSSFRLFSFCSVFIAHCVNRPHGGEEEEKIFRFINRKGHKLNEKPDQDQQISQRRKEKKSSATRRANKKKIFIIIMPNQITKTQTTTTTSTQSSSKTQLRNRKMKSKYL